MIPSVIIITQQCVLHTSLGLPLIGNTFYTNPQFIFSFHWVPHLWDLFYDFRICSIELFCSPIFEVYDGHTYFQRKRYSLADSFEFPRPSIHRFHKTRLGCQELFQCLNTCIQLDLVRVVRDFLHWNLEVPWPSSMVTNLGIVLLEDDCFLSNV